MSDAPIVIKVGGSLFDLADLGARLRSWLGALHRRELILVPGGGPTAEVVRDMDRLHRLGEQPSHWLALRALSLNTHLLARVLSRSVRAHVIEDLNERWEAWRQPGPPILDPLAFALADESSAAHLPHCWEVTSDSIAGRVALVVQARELILLKSVTIPPAMGWAEASRLGYVDRYFPTVVDQGVVARAVNLREWRP